MNDLSVSFSRGLKKDQWQRSNGTFIKVHLLRHYGDIMTDDLLWIFSLKTIAVVGASQEERKPSHYVPKYLKEKGYTMIPVNPDASAILSETSYSQLRDIPVPVDIVLMFRPSEEIPEFIDEIIKISPKVLWMQLGIRNHKAKVEAEKHGVYVVMDKCMMQEHKRLYGD